MPERITQGRFLSMQSVLRSPCQLFQDDKKPSVAWEISLAQGRDEHLGKGKAPPQLALVGRRLSWGSHQFPASTTPPRLQR